ncbi:MAG: ornithine cyclodeaminase [Pseudomonadota bacterium]
MEFIDANAMAKRADYAGIVQWLQDAHLANVDAMDDLLMTQPAATSGDDTVLIRAAWQRHQSIGVKLITVFPENTTASELPAIQAVYILFDASNGAPLATLDGTELTYWKTAADSALGVKLLARENADELLMVGAGAQAPYLIRAHCAVRPSIKRVTIWNRTGSKAEALAARNLIAGIEFTATEDIEAASRRASIICCATASEAPLVLGDWLAPGAHLDLVGGFKPEMIETDLAALNRSRVFVDCWDTTVDICGDLCHHIKAGDYHRDAIEGDLFDMCRRHLPHERADEDITIFKNGGGGHLDLMTAQYFVERMKS